LFVVISDHIDN